jgi:hypothetical protein
MRGVARRVALCMSLFFATARAQAETASELDDSQTWRPGERVTATVKGEPHFSDRMSSGDGVYGRFDGDLWLTLGAGVEWSHGVRPAIEARALYYHTLGLVVRYADAFDRDAFVRRDGSVGIEIRPLFLPRWSRDKEFQVAFTDLTLDSLTLGVAGYLAVPQNRDNLLGVELFAGFGVPLLGRASGPWLEARGFWRPAFDDATMGVLGTLSFYLPVVTPVVK